MVGFVSHTRYRGCQRNTRLNYSLEDPPPSLYAHTFTRDSDYQAGDTHELGEECENCRHSEGLGVKLLGKSFNCSGIESKAKKRGWLRWLHVDGWQLDFHQPFTPPSVYGANLWFFGDLIFSIFFFRPLQLSTSLLQLVWSFVILITLWLLMIVIRVHGDDGREMRGVCNACNF